MKMKFPVFLALLFFSLSTLLVSSCQKSNDPIKEPPPTENSVPGMYFKLDGVDQAFTERDTMYVWQAPLRDDTYELNFSARNQKQYINLFIESTKNDYKVGSYVYGDVYNPIAAMDYTPDRTKDLGWYNAGPYDYQTPGDVTITITEYTNNYAKGTFSGSVYLNSNIAWDGEKKKAVITDGRFYCRYKK